MRKVFLILLAVALLFLSAARADGNLRIVATDFPCYDFARQAAGDGAEVVLLLKPGTEAHAYDPTPSDILAISGADLFVYIGGESDAWVESILGSFDDSERPRTLRMMDVVGDLLEEDDDAGHHHEGEDGPEYDEHIWTSPVNAAKMVRAVGLALSEIDSEHSEAFVQAAEDYARRIEQLDAQIRSIVQSADRHTLIFADRFPFAYFVREYGLDYLAAFPSCTADTEPMPQTILSLIQAVESEAIPVVYTIELSTQNVARTVSEETGAQIRTMHSMQTVTQEEFGAGETYESLMRKNIDALREGLL